MTLKEVNDEISRLQSIQRQMHEEEINKHKTMVLQYVGRCYRSSHGQFIKIIGVPRTRLPPLTRKNLVVPVVLVSKVTFKKWVNF